MARQATLNVSLTPTLEHYIRSRVQSGRYESASQVIREGLRALQERERGERSFGKNLRKKVAEARADEKDRRVLDGETAMAAILAELDGDKPLKPTRGTGKR